MRMMGFRIGFISVFRQEVNPSFFDQLREAWPKPRSIYAFGGDSPAGAHIQLEDSYDIEDRLAIALPKELDFVAWVDPSLEIQYDLFYRLIHNAKPDWAFAAFPKVKGTDKMAWPHLFVRRGRQFTEDPPYHPTFRRNHFMIEEGYGCVMFRYGLISSGWKISTIFQGFRVNKISFLLMPYVVVWKVV